MENNKQIKIGWSEWGGEGRVDRDGERRSPRKRISLGGWVDGQSRQTWSSYLELFIWQEGLHENIVLLRAMLEQAGNFQNA